MYGSGGLARVQIEPRSIEGEVPGGDGLPTFFAAGRPALGEFRCADCGYGVVVKRVLPECPMCRGRAWEDPVTSPSMRSRD